MQDKKSFKEGMLSLEITEHVDDIELIFKGKSVERDPGRFLNPIFSDLLMEGKKKNKRIIVIFTTLDYMNSSTIMAISKFLEKGKDSNCMITVQYDNGRRWQKMSFNALKIFQTKDGQIIFEGQTKA